ncbi:hypothetical protein MHU86_4406 [Fragilaria crotonensis]|nr:hypothetical protein MHU86_4406 [Fragilaria crotonensis]
MSVVKIPNLVLPLPGFLVVALMDAYTIDATTLCLAAIAAINARAEPAGEDPSSSLLANRASYVAAWLWNLATKRTRAQGLGVVAGAHVSLAMKPRADAWARDVHLTKYYLTSQPSNTTVVRTRTGGNNDCVVGAKVTHPTMHGRILHAGRHRVALLLWSRSCWENARFA